MCNKTRIRIKLTFFPCVFCVVCELDCETLAETIMVIATVRNWVAGAQMQASQARVSLHRHLNVGTCCFTLPRYTEYLWRFASSSGRDARSEPRPLLQHIQRYHHCRAAYSFCTIWRTWAMASKGGEIHPNDQHISNNQVIL